MNDDTPRLKRDYPHYFKGVQGLEAIDVYRVLELFGVASPPIQHAIKKLLVAGGRGAKDRRTDYMEAAYSCVRAAEMLDEDAAMVQEGGQ